MSKLQKYTLLIIASTYPRWRNDDMRTFVQDYVRYIAPQFKRVQVVVPHYKGAKRREQDGQNIQVTRFYYALPFKYENIAYGEFTKTRFYPLKALLYNASELWSTLLVGLRWRPLMLNPHWMVPQGFVATVLKPVLRCQVVVSVHGSDVYTLNGKFMRKIKRFVLDRADAVVVNSSATQAACRDIFDRDYHVIPMGVDTSLFKQRAAKQAGTTFELLFVGRIDERKGIRYLLEATKILKERGLDVHTTIVGDGIDRSELEAYAAGNRLDEEVTFIGGLTHEQVAEYYAKADVFVGPSLQEEGGWREAFGLVFAEASATGVPVVATATGGIQDIIKDGVNGLTVPQKDAAAIADAVQKLQQDPALCQKLGAAGPRFIQDNFSWPVVIEKYQQVFENLA